MSEAKEKQKTTSMLVIEIPHESTQDNQMNGHVSCNSVTIQEEPAMTCNERHTTSLHSFGRPIGAIFNMALLISVTCYYALEVTRELRDPLHYDSVFKGVCWPTIIQLFDITLTLDLLMSAIILLIVFPLSRVKRNTVFYTFIAMFSSAVVLTLMFFLARHMTMVARVITIVDVTRLCLKMTSFLIECKRSDLVFSASSISTLRYYLFIPNFIYQTQYMKSSSISWQKVLSHLWWIWVALFPFMSLASGLLNRLARFDITTSDLSSLAINISLLMTTSLITFMVVVYFFLLRNLCSLKSQVARFAVSNGFGLKKWFTEYIYSPIFEDSKSNCRAAVCVAVCSLFIIELCAVYTFQVFIALNSLFIVTLLPLLLLLVHRHHALSWTVVLVIVSFNLFAYLMDLVVVNYSTDLSANAFEVRLIPLSMKLLLQQHCNIDIGSLEWIHLPRGIFSR